MMKRRRILLMSFVLLGHLFSWSCSAPPAPTSQSVSVPSETLFFIELSFPYGAYSEPQQRRGFVQQLLGRIKALPEVESAAISTSQQPVAMMVEAFPGESTHIYSAVTPDYFRTQKVELIQGRLFEERDGTDYRLAILSESVARRLFPDEQPIGKRIAFSQREERRPWLDIVGVVADEQESSDQPRTEIYAPYNQDSSAAVNLIVRAKTDTPTLAEKLKEEIRAVDNQVSISRVHSK